MKRRNGLMIVLGVLMLAALGARHDLLQPSATAQMRSTLQVPIFEVDPMWPKTLPNKWVIGSSVGVSVDAQNNIWMIHRPRTLANNEIAASLKPPTSTCCFPAPPVLEFNQAGDVIASWGGPGEGYEWPQSEHGIAVDYKGNVWIGGNGEKDSQLLKFTPAGKFLLQIGKAGIVNGAKDTQNLGRPAKVYVDPATNEAFIADGYLNHRVIVVDADTGQYKRQWGAYGHPPEDPDLGPFNPEAPPRQQFSTPVHCAEITRDNLVYVCDRRNNRLQVFRKDGTFVKEKVFQQATLGQGSVWDIAFSRDPEQRFIYMANGSDQEIYIVLRETLEIVSKFGRGGRYPGQFYAAHSIATDLNGNIYITETFEGKRIQKFVYKGLGQPRDTQ
jgi:DNA-binding beta-propeller fold protein YncE